jgi:hypothetical protein
MKAGMMLTLVFVVVAGAASAQMLKGEKRVIQEEVPVTIVKSIQNDFNVFDKGTWRIQYIHNTYNSTFAVERYVYVGKVDGKRVEVRYNPDGMVAYAKNVSVPEALASKK